MACLICTVCCNDCFVCVHALCKSARGREHVLGGMFVCAIFRLVVGALARACSFAMLRRVQCAAIRCCVEWLVCDCAQLLCQACPCIYALSRWRAAASTYCARACRDGSDLGPICDCVSVCGGERSTVGDERTTRGRGGGKRGGRGDIIARVRCAAAVPGTNYAPEIT